MAGKRASRKRSGAGKGMCSYCGGRHRGGPKGNSCGGHSVKVLTVHTKKVEESEGPFEMDPVRTVSMTKPAIRRRERAAERAKERAKRSPKEQLKLLRERGFSTGREVNRLEAQIHKAKKAEAEAKQEVEAA